MTHTMQIASASRRYNREEESQTAQRFLRHRRGQKASREPAQREDDRQPGGQNRRRPRTVTRTGPDFELEKGRCWRCCTGVS